MIETFIIHRDWLKNIEGLPVEQQDKIIAEIVRYGVEMDSQHNDDPITQAFVNMVKGSIDFSKDKYSQKIEAGKSYGKKKKIDEAEIHKLAREGKTSTQIADILGCSKSSVDHSEGWRNRDKDIFIV